MLDRLKSFLMEPGLIKTPTMGIAGLSWATIHGAFEATILIGTACIVILHVVTAITRRLCPKRRGGFCDTCPLQHSFWCPQGLTDRDEK